MLNFLYMHVTSLVSHEFELAHWRYVDNYHSQKQMMTGFINIVGLLSRDNKHK
jgi:hypothetical protein